MPGEMPTEKGRERRFPTAGSWDAGTPSGNGRLEIVPFFSAGGAMIAQDFRQFLSGLVREGPSLDAPKNGPALDLGQLGAIVPDLLQEFVPAYLKTVQVALNILQLGFEDAELELKR